MELERGLARELTARQLTMMAIGGAIGTGLFLGSSLAVRLAGPGVIVTYFLGAVVAFFFLPWLDRSPVRSMRYKGWMSRASLALFVVSFVALGYLGLQPAQGVYVLLARFFALIYFLYFIGMPFYTYFEKVKPVPERLTYHAH